MNTTITIQKSSASTSLLIPERLHSSFIEDRLRARQLEGCTNTVLAQHWYGPGYSVCSMQPTAIPCDSAVLTSPCPPVTQARLSTTTTTQSSSQTAVPASSHTHHGLSEGSTLAIILCVGVLGGLLMCYGIWICAKMAQRRSQQQRQSSGGHSARSTSTSGPPGDPPIAGHKSNPSSSTATSSLKTSGAQLGSIELQDRQASTGGWVSEQQKPRNRPPPWYQPRWWHNLSSLSSLSSSRSDRDRRGRRKSSDDVRAKGTTFKIVNAPSVTKFQATTRAPSKEKSKDKIKSKITEKTKVKNKDRSKERQPQIDQRSDSSHRRESTGKQPEKQQRPEKQKRIPEQLRGKPVVPTDQLRPQEDHYRMPGAYVSTSTSDIGSNSHEGQGQGPFMSGALQSPSPPPAAVQPNPWTHLYHPEGDAFHDRRANSRVSAPAPVRQQEQNAGGRRGSKRNSVPLPVWEEEQVAHSHERRASGRSTAPPTPPAPPPRHHSVDPFGIANDPIERPAAPAPMHRSQTHRRRDSAGERLLGRDPFRDGEDEERSERRHSRQDEERGVDSGVDRRREERRSSHRQVRFWGVIEDGSE